MWKFIVQSVGTPWGFWGLSVLLVSALIVWLYRWLCISPKHVMKKCAAVIYFSVLWYILYINLYTTYFSLYIFCMPSSCLRSLVNVVCGTLAGQGQGIGSFSYWSACWVSWDWCMWICTYACCCLSCSSSPSRLGI